VSFVLGYCLIVFHHSLANTCHARAFQQVKTLKLGWCKVGAGEGAAALADLLLFNSTLTAVDLRGNGLGNAGAAALARALKELTNEQLAELDLGYNEIKDEGACSLAQVCTRCG
jgi:Ran GTPase-activating protein (RanGAP) involved in mRNA processing and transport